MKIELLNLIAVKTISRERERERERAVQSNSLSGVSYFNIRQSIKAAK